MADERARLARELFLDALDQAPADRAAFLTASVNHPEEVRARAAELLAAHEGSRELFDAMEGGRRAPRATPGELEVGALLGPYRVLETLGSGGFGTVYLAEQSEPVVRRVALKVLRSGLRSASAKARFDAERQALARMEHPGIARVFDADTTPEGVPYFAMEYVPGVPITEYADDHRLGLGERLRLLEHVCRSVAHAHQRGIVHRDLKPTNVLVVEIDGIAHPKVIDFGVAKALDDPLTEAGVQSIEGELIGTPAYMSPEQASGELDLDTRADVYALGALMYELLAGAPPFDPRELGLARLLEAVIKDDPLLPSERHRSARDSTWSGRVPSDLDWIAMRCLEKQRGRRYQSASALAEDVRRFLDGRPVEAAPPSTLYRAKKLLRRHRVATLAACAVTLALVAGAVGIWLGLVRARDERDLARSVLRFVTQDLLGAVKPSAEEGHGRDVRMLDAVDVAARGLRDADAGEHSPRALAAIHSTLAEVYSALGEFDRAAVHFREAQALYASTGTADSLEALHCASDQVGTLRRLGHFDEAIALGRDVLSRQLAAGASDSDVVETQVRLAFVLNASGKRKDAIGVAEEALARSQRVDPPDPVLLSIAHNAVGVTSGNNTELERADHHFRRALELEEQLHGSGHPEVLTALGNVASNLQAMGRDREAEALLTEAIDTVASTLGPEHPDVLILRTNLGLARIATGAVGEAREELEPVVASLEARFGAGHAQTCEARAALARCQAAVGETDAAEDGFRAAYEGVLRTLGADARATQTRRNDLIDFLFSMRRGAGEVVELAEEAVDSRMRTSGPDHVTTLRAVFNLALMQKDAGLVDESERNHRDAVEGFTRTLGPLHAETLETRGALVDFLREEQRLEEAEQDARDVLSIVDAAVEVDATLLGKSRARLAFVLLDLDRSDEAKELLASARTALVEGVGANDVWVRYVDQLLAEIGATEN